MQGVNEKLLGPSLFDELFLQKKINMAGGTSCLSLTCSIIGILFATVSVAGIGLSLFLVFGEPYSQINVKGTYTPSWEDIGMYLLVLFN